MEFLVLLILVALVFGLCYLVDKGFQKAFRGKAQHQSGRAVRLSKRYGTGGILLFVLGLLAVFSGVGGSTVLVIGGGVILLTGVGLVIYYMTFGIYYDDDSFLVSGFAKKDHAYRYGQIKGQQLYEITGGNLLVELHMDDGSAVQLYSQMTGAKAFLDTAFLGWVRQNGIDVRTLDCDPEAYKWFPSGEGQ